MPATTSSTPSMVQQFFQNMDTLFNDNQLDHDDNSDGEYLDAASKPSSPGSGSGSNHSDESDEQSDSGRGLIDLNLSSDADIDIDGVLEVGLGLDAQTPPRPSLSKKQPPDHRNISTSTSPTHTAFTEKSKESSTVIYTCPDKDTDLGTHANANARSHGHGPVHGKDQSLENNPSGMVIHAQYAEEAIMDPTWLDSDDEDDEEERGREEAGDETETTTENTVYINESLLSGSCTGSVGGGSRSSSQSQSHSRGGGMSIGSLSVGSCGLGKLSFCDGISLSGSEGSSNHIGHGHVHGHTRSNSNPSFGSTSRKIHLNHVDIVDMGVESVDSVEGSNDHVLDYLYDLDRRDYDLSDGDDDGDDDADGDATSDEEHEEDEDSAYLPQYLISPPRLSRRNDDGELDDENASQQYVGENCQISIATEDDEFSMATDVDGHDDDDRDTARPTHTSMHMRTPVSMDAIKMPQMLPQQPQDSPTVTEATSDETLMLSPSSPSPPPLGYTRIDLDDDISVSSSVVTNLLSNCAPNPPTNLNDTKEGIVGGDVVLSILDCPGSKTRKKRSTRKAARNDTLDSFQWGAHAVSSAISCMRNLRRMKYAEISAKELQESSLASSRTTERILKQLEGDDEENTNQSNDFVGHSLRSVESGPKSPHRSESLDKTALDFMKNDEFQSALSVHREILQIYKDQSDQHSDKNGDEYKVYMNSTLLNIAIIHLCAAEYDEAFEVLNGLRQKGTELPLGGHLDVKTLLGHVYYARGQFEKSLNLWSNALHAAKKMKKGHKWLGELFNNIGCVYFEIGTETKALKYMKESLAVQQQNFQHDDNEKIHRHALTKLATTRANIAYIYLRIKNADQAITYFEDSLMDHSICLEPHHPLALSTMEHLAISYIRKKGKDKNNSKAIQIYSKMLTAKIESCGAEHEECAAILTKLNVLQLRGGDKAGIKACMKKIQKSTRENGSCQKERFEKLLKVYKVPGLKPISIRKSYS